MSAQITPRVDAADPLAEPLHLERVRVALGEEAAQLDVSIRARCTSTNTELLAAPAKPARIQVLCAEQQTAGRGRRGRVWHAAPASLLFSVRSDAPLAAAGLSLAAGVAVAEALERSGSAPVALKWPNDLWVDGAKAGGILVELASRGAQHTCVIGVGLNLRRPALATPYPVAGVFDGVPTPPARTQVLAEVLRALVAMLREFETAGFAPFRERFTARDAFHNRAVSLIDEAGARTGHCRGVDVDGALLLETEHGVARVLAGDVSLRAAP